MDALPASMAISDWAEPPGWLKQKLSYFDHRVKGKYRLLYQPFFNPHGAEQQYWDYWWTGFSKRGRPIKAHQLEPHQALSQNSSTDAIEPSFVNFITRQPGQEQVTDLEPSVGQQLHSIEHKMVYNYNIDLFKAKKIRDWKTAKYVNWGTAQRSVHLVPNPRSGMATTTNNALVAQTLGFCHDQDHVMALPAAVATLDSGDYQEIDYICSRCAAQNTCREKKIKHVWKLLKPESYLNALANSHLIENRLALADGDLFTEAVIDLALAKKKTSNERQKKRISESNPPANVEAEKTGKKTGRPRVVIKPALPPPITYVKNFIKTTNRPTPRFVNYPGKQANPEPAQDSKRPDTAKKPPEEKAPPPSAAKVIEPAQLPARNPGKRAVKWIRYEPLLTTRASREAAQQRAEREAELAEKVRAYCAKLTHLKDRVFKLKTVKFVLQEECIGDFGPVEKPEPKASFRNTKALRLTFRNMAKATREMRIRNEEARERKAIEEAKQRAVEQEEMRKADLRIRFQHVAAKVIRRAYLLRPMVYAWRLHRDARKQGKVAKLIRKFEQQETLVGGPGDCWKALFRGVHNGPYMTTAEFLAACKLVAEGDLRSQHDNARRERLGMEPICVGPHRLYFDIFTMSVQEDGDYHLEEVVSIHRDDLDKYDLSPYYTHENIGLVGLELSHPTERRKVYDKENQVPGCKPVYTYEYTEAPTYVGNKDDVLSNMKTVAAVHPGSNAIHVYDQYITREAKHEVYVEQKRERINLPPSATPQQVEFLRQHFPESNYVVGDAAHGHFMLWAIRKGIAKKIGARLRRTPGIRVGMVGPSDWQTKAFTPTHSWRPVLTQRDSIRQTYTCGSHCHHKFGTCACKQVDHVVAMYTSGIHLHEFVLGMVQSGATTADVILHCPPEILLADHYRDTMLDCNYTKTRDGMVRMTCGDALGYDDDFAAMSSWIDGGDCFSGVSVICETFQTVGSVRHFTLEVKPGRATQEPLPANYSTAWDDKIFLRDLELLSSNRDSVHDRRWICVDKHKYDKLKRLLLRDKPDNRTLENTRMRADGLTAAVIIGSNRLEERWDLSQEDHEVVCQHALAETMAIANLGNENVKILSEQYESKSGKNLISILNGLEPIVAKLITGSFARAGTLVKYYILQQLQGIVHDSWEALNNETSKIVVATRANVRPRRTWYITDWRSLGQERLTALHKFGQIPDPTTGRFENSVEFFNSVSFNLRAFTKIREQHVYNHACLSRYKNAYTRAGGSLENFYTTVAKLKPRQFAQLAAPLMHSRIVTWLKRTHYCIKIMANWPREPSQAAALFMQDKIYEICDAWDALNPGERDPERNVAGKNQLGEYIWRALGPRWGDYTFELRSARPKPSSAGASAAAASLVLGANHGDYHLQAAGLLAGCTTTARLKAQTAKRSIHNPKLIVDPSTYDVVPPKTHVRELSKDKDRHKDNTHHRVMKQQLDSIPIVTPQGPVPSPPDELDAFNRNRPDNPAEERNEPDTANNRNTSNDDRCKDKDNDGDGNGLAEDNLGSDKPPDKSENHSDHEHDNPWENDSDFSGYDKPEQATSRPEAHDHTSDAATSEAAENPEAAGARIGRAFAAFSTDKYKPWESWPEAEMPGEDTVVDTSFLNDPDKADNDYDPGSNDTVAGTARGEQAVRHLINRLMNEPKASPRSRVTGATWDTETADWDKSDLHVVQESAKLDWNGEVCKVALIQGVAASAKSSHTWKALGQQAYVVTPTKSLKLELLAKGIEAETTHKALLRIHEGLAPDRLVVIDEVFTYPACIVSAIASRRNRLLLLGDDSQIPRIDFENTGTPPYKGQWAELKLTLPVSWTVPKDAMTVAYRLTNNPRYREYVSTRGKDRSIRFVSEETDAKCLRIANSQRTAAIYKNRGAITTHRAQGLRSNQTLLYINNKTDLELATKSKGGGHWVVALTRHRDKLYLQADLPGTKAFYYAAGIHSRISFTASSQHVFNSRPVHFRKEAIGSEAELLRARFTAATATAEAIWGETLNQRLENTERLILEETLQLREIRATREPTLRLQETIDGLSKYHPEQDYATVTANADWNAEGGVPSKFKGKFESPKPQEIKKHTVLDKAGIYQSGQDTVSALHCISKRYARRMAVTHWTTRGDAIAARMKELVQDAGGKKNSELLRLATSHYGLLKGKNVMELAREAAQLTTQTSDIDRLAQHYHDGVHKLLVRPPPEEYEQAAALEDWLKTRTNNQLRRINEAWGELANTVGSKGFMKSQEKFKPEPGFGNQREPGQGIAGTSGAMNVIFCSFVDEFARRLRHCLPANILLDMGLNEMDFERWCRHFNAHSQFNLQIDISKQDSTHTIAMVEALRKLGITLGLGGPILDALVESRSHYYVEYLGNQFTYETEYKMRSGEPVTLFGNTVMALMALCHTYRVEPESVVCLKGDDTYAKDLLPKRSYNSTIERLFARGGHELFLKVNTGLPSCFTSRLIAPSNRTYPDYVRMIAKHSCKDFTRTSEYDLWMAWRDRCKLIHEEDRQWLIGALTVMYPGITNVDAILETCEAMRARNSWLNTLSAEFRFADGRKCVERTFAALGQPLSRAEKKVAANAGPLQVVKLAENHKLPVHRYFKDATGKEFEMASAYGIHLYNNHCFAVTGNWDTRNRVDLQDNRIRELAKEVKRFNGKIVLFAPPMSGKSTLKSHQPELFEDIDEVDWKRGWSIGLQAAGLHKAAQYHDFPSDPGKILLAHAPSQVGDYDIGISIINHEAPPVGYVPKNMLRGEARSYWVDNLERLSSEQSIKTYHVNSFVEFTPAVANAIIEEIESRIGKDTPGRFR